MFSRTRRSLKRSLIVLLSLPMAAALLEGQTSPSGAKKIDACSFLTKAEIQEVLGNPVKDGKSRNSTNPAPETFVHTLSGIADRSAS